MAKLKEILEKSRSGTLEETNLTESQYKEGEENELDYENFKEGELGDVGEGLGEEVREALAQYRKDSQKEPTEEEKLKIAQQDEEFIKKYTQDKFKYRQYIQMPRDELFEQLSPEGQKALTAFRTKVRSFLKEAQDLLQSKDTVEEKKEKMRDLYGIFGAFSRSDPLNPFFKRVIQYSLTPINDIEDMKENILEMAYDPYELDIEEHYEVLRAEESRNMKSKFLQTIIPGFKPFNPIAQRKSINPRLDSLHFWRIYPMQIKKWIMSTKMNAGLYDKKGIWVNTSRYSGVGQRISLPKTHLLIKRGVRNLEPDLVDGYRFGIRPEELEGLHPKLKEFMSLKYASEKEIVQYRIHQAIKRHGNFLGDTGSAHVQCAVFSERVNNLVRHMSDNRTDLHNKKNLRELIARRFRMMRFCRRNNPREYWDVVNYYKLNDYGVYTRYK